MRSWTSTISLYGSFETGFVPSKRFTLEHCLYGCSLTLNQNRASLASAGPDFCAFHEIQRHAIHSTETLAVAVNSTRTLLRHEHKIFNSSARARESMASKNMSPDLTTQSQMLENLRLRSEANEKRLGNEITLVSPGVLFDG